MIKTADGNYGAIKKESYAEIYDLRELKRAPQTKIIFIKKELGNNVDCHHLENIFFDKYILNMVVQKYHGKMRVGEQIVQKHNIEKLFEAKLSPKIMEILKQPVSFSRLF